MPARTNKSNSLNIMWLIALHLAIVLPLAYFLNIWTDEASTLYSTQHGLLNAIQHAATDEKQAPLYFWVMSLWRGLNESILFARLFAVIVSCTSIAFFSRLAGRIFEPRAALLMTAFFAFHPFLIWASVEIRVYSSVILLSILLLMFFLSAFSEEFHAKPQRSQNKGKIAFLVIAVVSLYTNYYLGFLLVGMFVALVATRQWRAARDYMLVMLIAGLAFAPQLFTVKSQFLTHTSGFREPVSLIEGLRAVWHHVVTFLLPTGILRDGDGSAVQVIRAWIVRLTVTTLVILAVIFRQKLSRRTAALGSITATICAALFAAYFLVGLEYIQIRHASVLFVPLVFFAASLISDLSPLSERKALNYLIPVAGFIVLLAFSYAIVTLYPNMTKRGDWARVGEFIRQNESPGQPIVVFPTFDAIALPYHYRGINEILPKDKFFAFEQEAAYGTENSLKNQIDFVTSQIPLDADGVWLVEHEQCITTEACAPLENFVKANYTIEKEQDFYLERALLLKRKPK